MTTKTARKTFEDWLEDPTFAKIYQSVIRKIALRDRTWHEILVYLHDRDNLSNPQIDLIVKHLTDKGYLDDRRYTVSEIRRQKEALWGYHKRANALSQKGIKPELIASSNGEHDSVDEQNLAKKLAQKRIGSIRGKSVRSSQQKLQQLLISAGFDFAVIPQALASVSFETVKADEGALCRAAALKARRKYESKHHGWALRDRCFRALALQGYPAESIRSVLDEMEFSDATSEH
jgi:SOS response regulatory protein OraA/RecX